MFKKYFRTEGGQEGQASSKTRFWYVLKASKYVLLIGIVISITLNIYFCGITDDFMDAVRSSKKTTRAPRNYTMRTFPKRSAPVTESLMEYPGPYALRVKRNPGDKTPLKGDLYDYEKTSLSLLIGIFPATVATGLMFGMEVCGQAFRDPLSKWATIILEIIACLLALELFILSLFAVIRYPHATMVITCMLSIILFKINIVDIVYTARFARRNYSE